MGTKISTEEFIKMSKEKFGNKFSYNNTVLFGMKTHVKITCKYHGDFTCHPEAHLRKWSKGCCPSCKTQASKDALTTPIIDILNLAQQRFGASIKVLMCDGLSGKTKIRCDKHGDSTLTTTNFLNSEKGCPKCGYAAGGVKQHMGLEVFVNRSKEVFGDAYDYSLVDYVNNRVKVKITCKVHGVFEKSPEKHLAGQGCPKCQKEKPSTKRLKHEEFIKRVRYYHGVEQQYLFLNPT